MDEALVTAGGATLAEALSAAHGMLSVAAGFQGDEPVRAGCDTATAAAAFFRIDNWWRVISHDANGFLQFQIKDEIKAARIEATKVYNYVR
jgi:hypothetical protein